MQIALFMAVCGVVYVIGIPLFCVFILWKNRKLITDSELANSQKGESFRDTYGSLFTSYDVNNWYFESVEMIKKMTLAGGLVLVAPGSSVQILVGILVAFAYLIIVLQSQPYDDPNDNKLQAFATVQIVLTLLAGVMMKTDVTGVYEEGLMGILLIVLNGSVILIGLFAIFLSCSCCNKVSKNDDNKLEQESKSATKSKATKKSNTKIVPLLAAPPPQSPPLQPLSNKEHLSNIRMDELNNRAEKAWSSQ